MMVMAEQRDPMDSVAELVERIGDARTALRAAAPGIADRPARTDTAVVLHEMRRTLHAIAAAAAVVTDLRRSAPADAAPFIAGHVTAGDVVLVKGSRGTRTDLVVEKHMAVFG